MAFYIFLGCTFLNIIIAFVATATANVMTQNKSQWMIKLKVWNDWNYNACYPLKDGKKWHLLLFIFYKRNGINVKTELEVLSLQKGILNVICDSSSLYKVTSRVQNMYQVYLQIVQLLAT